MAFKAYSMKKSMNSNHTQPSANYIVFSCLSLLLKSFPSCFDSGRKEYL